MHSRRKWPSWWKRCRLSANRCERRVPKSSALLVDLVDQHPQPSSDFRFQPLCRDVFLMTQQAHLAFFTHLFWQGAGQLIGGGSLDGRIRKRTDTIELRFVEKVEQLIEEQRTHLEGLKKGVDSEISRIRESV